MCHYELLHSELKGFCELEDREGTITLNTGPFLSVSLMAPLPKANQLRCAGK